jgi:uncharacterized protein YegL
MTPDSAAIRRMPVYLVLDCSGSMAGEPIAALQMGLKALLRDLHDDPFALDTVWISVITFASAPLALAPLTDLSEFTPPELTARGSSALGAAIDLLARRIRAEVRTTQPGRKGDWKPLVFILTDGEPTDEWEASAEAFRKSGVATTVACGAGPEVEDDILRRLGDHFVRLEDTTMGTLGAFMKWVSESVSATNRTLGTRSGEALALPPDDTIRLVQ